MKIINYRDIIKSSDDAISALKDIREAVFCRRSQVDPATEVVKLQGLKAAFLALKTRATVDRNIEIDSWHVQEFNKVATHLSRTLYFLTTNQR
jgi:hypothetical protein